MSRVRSRTRIRVRFRAGFGLGLPSQSSGGFDHLRFLSMASNKTGLALHISISSLCSFVYETVPVAIT